MTEATEDYSAPAPAPPRKFAVRNYVEESRLKGDTSYTLTNLSDAMQQQAGLVVHYSTQAAKASRQVDDIKLILEATEATVYRQLRDAALKAGEKVTEAQLEKGVIASPRITSIKRALNEAKQIEAIAKGVVSAIKDKKDMLVQEGAASREERKGEIRIMAAAAADSGVEALKNRFINRTASAE